ncbi:hypothetical protein ACFX2J_031596 [Malus domestica]
MPYPSGQSISRHSSCISQKPLRIQLVHSHLLPPQIFFTAQHLPSSHSHYSGHHWRIITSAFSHISMKAMSKLVKNDSSVHQGMWL